MTFFQNTTLELIDRIPKSDTTLCVKGKVTTFYIRLSDKALIIWYINSMRALRAVGIEPKYRIKTQLRDAKCYCGCYEFKEYH